MMKKFQYRGITWIDLEAPREPELAELAHSYDLHAQVLSDLCQNKHVSKIDYYNNCILLTLSFLQGRDIVFVISKDFVITAHDKAIPALGDFVKIFENDLVFKRSQEKLYGGYLFFHILKSLYASLEREIIENGDFNLWDLRSTLTSHKSILASLKEAPEKIFGRDSSYYHQSLSAESKKIWQLTEELRLENEELDNAIKLDLLSKIRKLLIVIASVLVAILLLNLLTNTGIL